MLMVYNADETSSSGYRWMKVRDGATPSVKGKRLLTLPNGEQTAQWVNVMIAGAKAVVVAVGQLPKADESPLRHDEADADYNLIASLARYLKREVLFNGLAVSPKADFQVRGVTIKATSRAEVAALNIFLAAREAEAAGQQLDLGEE